MITLSDKTRVHGVWFIGDRFGDVFSILWCDEKGEWLFHTRLRSNGDGAVDPHSPANNDKKSWMKGTVPVGADLDAEFERLTVIMHQIAVARVLMYGAMPEFDAVRTACRGDELMVQLKDKSWIWPSTESVN